MPATPNAKAFRRKVRFMAAAAPPPESVLAAMADAGFEVVHVYGLTEVYGPPWSMNGMRMGRAGQRRAAPPRKARQGVRYAPLEGLTVLNPKTMKPVPADGKTIGEVMMPRQYRDARLSEEPQGDRGSFQGGWFHTGDLGVMYPDGYIQLKDRSKDIIISGGENISSIEVEERHRQASRRAVRGGGGQAGRQMGRASLRLCRTCARPQPAEADILAFASSRLAKFKMPRTVVFTELPKTSTGKIQKFVLRDRAHNSRGPAAARFIFHLPHRPVSTTHRTVGVIIPVSATASSPP
jgi:fatty-acyl-CoA synthase